MRILLAEDERELSNALTAILKHNNYSVDAVYNGAEALNYALAADYDAIIMDIMMPKMSGLEDKVTGLDAGADDYLTKPFAMSELLARLRAMTRRSADYAPEELRFGNVTLSRATFEMSTPQGAVRLGNKEFQMME